MKYFRKDIIKVQVVGYIHINRLLHGKMKIIVYILFCTFIASFSSIAVAKPLLSKYRHIKSCSDCCCKKICKSPLYKEIVKIGVNCFVFKLIFSVTLLISHCAVPNYVPPPSVTKLLSKATIKLRATTTEACSQNYAQLLSASSCLSFVRRSIREEQLDSHWTNFH